MSPQERDYYRERGQAERVRAAQATDEVIAQIHDELGRLYERLVELDERNPKPASAVPQSTRDRVAAGWLAGFGTYPDRSAR